MLPGNFVAHIKHAYFVSNCDMIENSHMLLMHSDCFRTYRGTVPISGSDEAWRYTQAIAMEPCTTGIHHIAPSFFLYMGAQLVTEVDDHTQGKRVNAW